MKIINNTIILLATCLLAWIIPDLYHLATDKGSKSIFTYYSSVEKSFCSIGFDEANDKILRKNINTNREYSESEFDSILPMFYHRQLLSDGRMPDSIHGVPVSAKEIRNKSFFFRYNPTDKNKAHIPLYTLFESISGRVRLEMPGDLFRLKNGIEFIDPETNLVNQAKSALFMKEFVKRKFKFPAKLAAGNPSTRKAYDEGYILLDSADKLFHLKMVNAKPYLRAIEMPLDMKPVHISVLEPSDRSLYAFVFDQNNKMFMLSTDAYKMMAIPCPKFNVNSDKLIIMANLLYWNVNVISKEGKSAFAIDAKTKTIVDSLTVNKEKVKTSFVRHMFPFALRFESYSSKYLKPRITMGHQLVLLFNLFFMALYIGVNLYRKRKINLVHSIWIALTGVFGFIPCLIIHK